MKKRLFALLCTLILLVGAIPSAGALAGEANRSADILNTLGPVNGTADAGYNLTAPATRAQAAVLLVRLAGAEDAAAADPWFAGYRDVPAWCKRRGGLRHSSGLAHRSHGSGLPAQQHHYRQRLVHLPAADAGLS